MRLAVISVPVAAAQGVAARSFQITSPSSALNPSVQVSTEDDCRAHPAQASTTSVPAKGSTTSNTSFDCQPSVSSATLHRNLWVHRDRPPALAPNDPLGKSKTIRSANQKRSPWQIKLRWHPGGLVASAVPIRLIYNR